MGELKDLLKDGFFQVSCQGFTAGVTIKDGLVSREGSAPMFGAFVGKSATQLAEFIETECGALVSVNRVED